MSDDLLKIAVYPTLAPPSSTTVYQADVITELITVCKRLIEAQEPFTPALQEKIERYFTSYLSIDDLTYHFEILLTGNVPLAETVIERLSQQFPQIVWLRLSVEATNGVHKTTVFIEFLPLVRTEATFPITVHLQQSIKQQLQTEDQLAPTKFKKLVAKTLATIIEEEKVTVIERPERYFYKTAAPTSTKITKRGRKKKKRPKKIAGTTIQQPSNVNQEELPAETLRNKVLASFEQSKKLSPESILDAKEELTEANFLAIKEEARREQASKERLRLANEKLELVVESLELAMFHSGIKYFDSQLPAEDENWHRYLKISLKEYTYLLQKAKYLEQMWRINEALVQKVEKMTVTENVLTYERGQIHQSAQYLSAKDIHLVLYECNLIESRVNIHKRPLFVKPYVKIMKMDYDNLLRKAAYFDLLQGESFLMEQKIIETESANHLKKAKQSEA